MIIQLVFSASLAAPAGDELARLTCNGMVQNEVRLQLYTMAYNLGTVLQGADQD